MSYLRRNPGLPQAWVRTICGVWWLTAVLLTAASVGQEAVQEPSSPVAAAVAGNAKAEDLPTVAVISGPATAPSGELVVLSSSRSVGVSYIWIIPEDKAKVADGCGGVDSQVFFATSIPGTYQFILVVSDKDAKLTYAIHHVTIPGAEGLPEPGPTDPVQPPPVDPEPGFGRYENLFKTSQLNSRQLDDPNTREALHTSLTALLETLRPRLTGTPPLTVAAMQTAVTGAIEDVLLFRKDSSRDIEWEQGWRVPNSQWLAQENPTTPEAYFQAMMALTAGLK
jgi:hypothetical protein